MFYQPKNNDHGLAKNPFNSLVLPRPIGWISSMDAQGVFNLAPYSFFNAVCYRPPTVMFSSGIGAAEDGRKDSLRNIEETGEFVCNLATWETRERMNQSSASVGPEIDEIALAGLTAEPSQMVKAPRVAEAPVHLECKYIKSVDIPGWKEADHYVMVLGEVVGIHIADELITADGLVNVGKMRPVGRMGYNDYSRVDLDTIFEMRRPD